MIFGFEENEWDLFIAHAGTDIRPAERLYEILAGSSRTFLASKCLDPGDDWDQKLSKAQRKSHITVVLVSQSTEEAYYAREEIASAIAMAREYNHRVVPVLLDEARFCSIPYGLLLKHSILVNDINDLSTVADQLLSLLRKVLGDEADFPLEAIDRELQVERNNLAEQILNLVEERKIAFLIGGLKSGRKTLQQQILNFLDEERNQFEHYVTRFSKRRYDRFYSTTKELAEEKDWYFPNPEINCFLACLAYSAYLEIAEDENVDKRELERLVLPKAGTKPSRFAQSYSLYATSSGGADNGNDSKHYAFSETLKDNIKHFLRFLEALTNLRAVDQREVRTTVFLPYEEVGEIFESKLEDGGLLVKDLWQGMLDFCQENWNLNGELKPNAFVNEIGKVGVLIGVPAVALGRHPKAVQFIRRSVVAVPPLGGAEIEELGAKVVGAHPSKRVVGFVEDQSGGHPWLVRVLMGILKADLLKVAASEQADGDLKEVFERGSVQVWKVFCRDHWKLAQSRGGEVLAKEISEYFEQLDRLIGTHDSKDDPEILKAWRVGSKRLEAVPRLARWLATGLVFLESRGIEDQDSLFGLSNYPRVWLRPAAPLALALLDAWRESRAAVDVGAAEER